MKRSKAQLTLFAPLSRPHCITCGRIVGRPGETLARHNGTIAHRKSLHAPIVRHSRLFYAIHEGTAPSWYIAQRHGEQAPDGLDGADWDTCANVASLEQCEPFNDTREDIYDETV